MEKIKVQMPALTLLRPDFLTGGKSKGRVVFSIVRFSVTGNKHILTNKGNHCLFLEHLPLPSACIV